MSSDLEPTRKEQSRIPIILKEFKSEIEFKNVSFATIGNLVLKNVNLTVEKGKDHRTNWSVGRGENLPWPIWSPDFMIQTGGEVLIDGVSLRDMRSNR
jgi:subfamily B ATP-binding cassette protein MsbA